MWSAAIIGLLGSFHCVGMCGPLLLSIPDSNSTRFQWFINKIIYHLTRLIPYSVLGFIAGNVGYASQYFGAQQTISITLGIFLFLFGALKILHVSNPFVSSNFSSKFFTWIGSKLKSIKHPMQLQALMGFLNGWLPCGFVYMALAGAAIQSSGLEGSLYMFCFGLGTIPALLALSFTGKKLSANQRRMFTKLFPYALTIMGILLIVRGMNLNIPFISPSIENPAACCKP